MVEAHGAADHVDALAAASVAQDLVALAELLALELEDARRRRVRLAAQPVALAVGHERQLVCGQAPRLGLWRLEPAASRTFHNRDRPVHCRFREGQQPPRCARRLRMRLRARVLRLAAAADMPLLCAPSRIARLAKPLERLARRDEAPCSSGSQPTATVPRVRRLASDASGTALGMLVAAGAVLRFATLDTQSFWRDEASTVLLIRNSLEGVLRGVSEHEATPPLYFVLAWVWTQVAGTGEVGLRSLSALIGTLTIPVAFAIGVRLGGRSAGLVAAALIAFNPFLIWFSQEARAYALFVLLTSIATLFWLRAMTEPDRRAPLAWGAAGALAMLGHYFAVFILIPQAGLLLWRAGAGRGAAARGGAVVVAAAVALAPLALAQRDARVDWVGETALRDRVLDVPKHWVGGPFGNPVDVAVGVGALLLATGAVLAMARLPRDEAWRSLLLAVAALAGVMLPVVAVAAGVDYVLDRYLVASLVPLLAVAAHGLSAFRAGRVAAAALGCMLLAFTLTSGSSTRSFTVRIGGRSRSG